MKSFRQFLKEKWVADLVLPMFGQPKSEPPVSVYENPTSFDLAQLNKDGLLNGMVRFISIPSINKVFVWDAQKSLHDPALFQLQKQKKIPSKININRVDLVLGGIARLSGGELTYDFSIIDVNLERMLNAIEDNSVHFKRNIPTPYTSLEDFKKALPNIEKSYRFTGKYLTGFQEINPFIRIMRGFKLRTLE